MSGDVQPRKRKDKRRKKEDELSRSLSSDEPDEAPPAPVKVAAAAHGHHGGDKGENIHVHHDHGIGGGIFVKIIFFALLAVILGLVGVIFIELRGSTDVDAPSIEDSRFAEYFTGWLDDSPDDHGGHDEHGVGGDDDHGDHDEEEHDSGGHDDHDDEGHDEEDEHADEEEEEEDNSGAANSENEASEADDEEPSAEPDASQIDESAEEDDEENNDDEDDEEDENTAEEVMSAEVEDENDNDASDEQEHVSNDNNDEDEEEEEDDQDDEDEEDDEDDYDLTQEDDSNEEVETSAEKDVEANSTPDDDKSAEIKETTKEDIPGAKVDPPDSETSVPLTKKKFLWKKITPVDTKSVEVNGKPSEEAEIIEESAEALKEEEEAVKKEKLSVMEEEVDLDDVKDVKVKKKKERELMRKLEKMLKEQKKKEAVNNAGEDGDNKGKEEDELEETGGVALKLGVGVALIIVAHMVIVRRWRSLANHDEGEAELEEVKEEEKSVEPTSGPEEASEPVISRRQTLVPEKTKLPKNLLELEDMPEEDAPPLRRRSSMDVKLERMDPAKYYTEEELGDSEELDEEEGYEEELLEEEEYVEEEEELEGSQAASELGEAEEELDQELYEEEEELEEEEEEEEVRPPPRPPVAPPRRGPQGVDEEEIFKDIFVSEIPSEEDELSTETPEKKVENFAAEPKLEDDDDWLFRQELDFADEQFAQNVQLALDKYTEVVLAAPGSLRGAIGRARALDKLAELKRSNALLSDAIVAYQTILTFNGSRLNDTDFRQLLDRCVDRMKFAGRNLQAAQMLEVAVARFPDEPSHMNAMAVSYLLAGSNDAAQAVLEKALAQWPQDGFSLVHLGFVYKTAGELEKGARLLEQGLQTGHPGTLDGRFVFHLGDALHRLGRPEEAMNWYEIGASKGLFKSKYQRSLYNVDRLKAQPWWALEETTYHAFFRILERNWKKIREEGLALLSARNASLFKDEAESLRDTGDWKQLDLFSRGRRQGGCVKAPETCELIGKFAPAAGCTRGQAKFSVMEPGTHVWPHCGPTNCRLRAHLGLVVPPGVYLRVAQTTKSWEAGKVLVFDDSFEHEVWHNGTSQRLVLIVDVWHPELTHTERQNLTPI